MLYLPNADTALWVLRKEKELAKEGEINELENKEEASSLTCLHLLAKMPHAFRSHPESSRMGELKKFLYCCMSLRLYIMFFLNKNISV